MKNAIRMVCVLTTFLVLTSCRHGSAPGNTGIPVDNGTECSRISLSPVEGVSETPFGFCTDAAGATDGGALDSTCSKTYGGTCSAGKCQEQGRGECIAVDDSDRSAGVKVAFDPGTCRADADKCTDAKKPLRCEGKITVPAGKKLQCKCDCTHGITAIDFGPDLKSPLSREVAALAKR
ncbi:MAG TPA: hypothetical protein VHW72_12500 [Candidatus Angelobacter sp.]|nr:hypothetical protein [Candidatus Angelobacter sp.]